MRLRLRSRRRRAAGASEHRVLPLALALDARAPFALSPRRAKVRSLRSRSSRRAASQLSEHPALPLALALALSARAPSALLSDRFLARETMPSFAWNTRVLHCYSVCFAASENSHLVRNLVRVVFALPQKQNAAKSRRVRALDWRGRRDSYSYNLRRLSKLLKTRYSKPAEISTLGWRRYVLRTRVRTPKPFWSTVERVRLPAPTPPQFLQEFRKQRFAACMTFETEFRRPRCSRCCADT
jgi:hypothetical protein